MSQHTAGKTGSRGAFEACFATGLDLSEFETSPSKSRAPSASSQLLEIKTKEAAIKKHHEEEEFRMQQAVEKRRNELHNKNLSISSSKLLSSDPDRSRANTLGSVLAASIQPCSTESDRSSQSRASRKLGSKNRRKTRQKSLHGSRFAKKKNQVKF